MYCASSPSCFCPVSVPRKTGPHIIGFLSQVFRLRKGWMGQDASHRTGRDHGIMAGEADPGTTSAAEG